VEAAVLEQKRMSVHAIELIKSLEQKGYKNDFLIELVQSLITRIK
jgi:hypothetical protein